MNLRTRNVAGLGLLVAKITRRVRYGPKADTPVAPHMSAFGGKADLEVKGFTFAYDPKRTSLAPF